LTCEFGTPQVKNRISILYYFLEIKTCSKELHNSNYDKDVFEKVVSDTEKKFNQKISISYNEFISARKQFVSDLKSGKMSQQLDDKVYSNEAIKIMDNIRALFEKVTNGDELKQTFKLVKQQISDNIKMSSNEKRLFMFKVSSVEKMALESISNSNTRTKDINDLSPSCSWWKWGCVIFVSLNYPHILIGIWIANLGSPLELYVQDFGLDYIASCCGFCGCNCPAGCPTYY
jgi:hypothetical protein